MRRAHPSQPIIHTGALALGLLATLGSVTPARARAVPPPARPSGPVNLETLVAALQKTDANAQEDRLSAFLPLVERLSGQRFVKGVSLQAEVVKGQQGMVGAFLAAVPRNYDPCASSIPDRPKVFWLATPGGKAPRGTVRLLAASTEAWNGGEVSVAVPATFPGVPFFTLSFESTCEEPQDLSHYRYDKKLVEVWSVVAGGVKLHQTFKSRTLMTAGMSEKVHVTAEWLVGPQSTTYLAVTLATITRTLLGRMQGETDCDRTVTAYSATAQGRWAAIRAADLTLLRAKQPAFRKLASPISSRNAAVCESLAPPEK